MDQPIRVLQVDDDPELAELTAAFLAREDDRFAVETATSAPDGLDRLAADGFDCVVSDYDMPGTNGLEFLEAVREDHPDVPFILFTGKGSEEVASEAISAGVTDYLQKGTGSDQYAVLANRIANAVEARRSRRALTERTRRLETLIDNLPGMVYRCRNEPGWPMETVEGEVEALTGHPAAAFEDQEVVWGDDVLHPADREEMWETVQEALDRDEPFEVTYRIHTADGETKWAWERGRGIYTDAGELEALEGFIADITERREREEALRASEARFRNIAESATDAVVTVDEESTVRFANPAVERVFGYSPEEVTGESLTMLMPERYRDPHREALDRYLETGRARLDWRDIELKGLHRDGSEPELSIAFGEFEQAGNHRFTGVIRDITERKEAERELRRYEALVESLPDSVYMFDTDKDCTYVNQQAIESSPRTLTRDDFIGASLPTVLADIANEEQARRVLDVVDRVIEGDRDRARETLTFEVEGATVHADTIAARVESADGEFLGIVSVLRDITNRVELEGELEWQNERLEKFASLVSHDIRNPLAVAQGNLELAREDADSEDLEAVARALERIDALTEDLLTLARQGEPVGETEPVSLETLAEACWQNVDVTEGTLSVRTDRTVRADRSRLQQLLENLLRNAVEHGGEDVGITVADLESGFYVADDGPGIPPEERERVFESGYSTAERGTGFGLQIVQQVAEAHGWDVTVTESADGGARFEVTGVESLS